MKTTDTDDDAIFGRIRPDGNVDVLDADGVAATRILTTTGVYPVGSLLGLGYDHPEGIVLAREDAERIGLEIEEG